MAIVPLNKLYHPEIFQGYGESKGYFEGWYYKIIDKTEKNIYAVIPGISLGSGKEESHCFIQILDGTHSKSAYIKYDINSFRYNKRKFEVWIGNSYFSANKLVLNIDNNDWRIKGELDFNNRISWPKTILSPNSMGWYAFVPFMECYHGILSMYHEIKGTLYINNENIDFTGGRGYMEKDWGRSFPSSWIWLQCNHFKRKNTSITCSIANIPWLGRSFTGLLGGFSIDNKVYRFTTYTGAKINKNNICENFSEIEIEDKRFFLEIDVRKSSSAELLSPKNGLMEGVIQESMSSEIIVKLSKKMKNGRELIFNESGRNTALEIMGDIKELIVK